MIPPIPVVVRGTMDTRIHISSASAVPPLATRRFTIADKDMLTFSNGGSPLSRAELTIAWIWRPRSVHAGGLVYAGDVANTSEIYQINPFNDGFYWFSGTQMLQYIVDTWTLDAVTNTVAGAAKRVHQYNYSTGVWTHTAKGAAAADPGLVLTQITVGRFNNNATQFLDADLAALGVWGRPLSDGELETLTASPAAWIAQAPSILWLFNQPSILTSVPDSSGGGSVQTARTGTTVSFGQLPAAFRY